MLSDSQASTQLKSQEKVLNIDRKRALYIVITQSILLLSYTILLILNAKKFTTLSVVLMSILVAVILGCSFSGFNTIFYVDQLRMGLYKILNVATYFLLAILYLCQQFLMKKDQNGANYETQFIITACLIGIVLLLDIYLVVLLKNLETKWRRASEKSLIKSAVFDRESYENVLQTSLLVDKEKN